MVREVVDRKKNTCGYVNKSTTMRSAHYGSFSSYEPDCSAISYGMQDTTASHIPDVANGARFISPPIDSQQNRYQFCNNGKNLASTRLNQIAIEISRAQTVIKQEVKCEPPDTYQYGHMSNMTGEDASLSRGVDDNVRINSNVSNSSRHTGEDIDRPDYNQLQNLDQMNISPSPSLSQFSIMWQLQNGNSRDTHTHTSSSSDRGVMNPVFDSGMNSSFTDTRIAPDSLPSIPNAYEIQRHLQDTISLTSFQPLPDSADCDRVPRMYPSGHMDVRLQTIHNILPAMAAPPANTSASSPESSSGLPKTAPLVQKSEESLRGLPTNAPLVQKSPESLRGLPKTAPLVQKSQTAPLVRKSQTAPLVQKSQTAPLVQKSQTAPLVQKSQIINTITTDDHFQTRDPKFQEKHVREKTRYRPYGVGDRTGVRLAKQVREALAYTAYLQCVLNTLLKQWEEYITLPEDRLQEMEGQNGKENEYNDDAQAMLDDEHSHIWQLVREMQPRDFTLDPEKLLSSLASHLSGSNGQQNPCRTTHHTKDS